MAIPERSFDLYKEQYWLAVNFLEDYLGIRDCSAIRILEVGSAEGGVLNYFASRGHNCYGIEYSRSRYEQACNINQHAGIRFIHGDITKPETYIKQLKERIDLIICCDVIEHISDAQKKLALLNMKNLIGKNGRLFISFPPKYSPFAGHQQVVPSWAGRLPYLFLLPDELYKSYLKLLKTKSQVVSDLISTKHSRLSISKFEMMVKTLGFKIIKKEFYLIRPIFEYRYGISRLKYCYTNKLAKEIFTLGAVYLLYQ